MVCVAGGFGVATIMPIARALKAGGQQGHHHHGRPQQETCSSGKIELRRVSDELIVTTDDGSYGRKGLVTEPLKELLASGRED